MTELSKSHDQYCMEIAAVLGVPESEIRPHTRVIVRQHLRAAGMALGHRIWLHHDLAAGHDLDELRGLYIHELAHTFQRYSFMLSPTWLDEGIADYVRFKLEPGSNWAKRAKRGLIIEVSAEPLEIHYTDGYFTATALLLHIEKHYDPEFVKSIHRELLAGRYRKSFFQERTGKDLDTLWQELIAKPAPLCPHPPGGPQLKQFHLMKRLGLGRDDPLADYDLVFHLHHRNRTHIESPRRFVGCRADDFDLPAQGLD